MKTLTNSENQYWNYPQEACYGFQLAVNEAACDPKIVRKAGYDMSVHWRKSNTTTKKESVKKASDGDFGAVFRTSKQAEILYLFFF